MYKLLLIAMLIYAAAQTGLNINEVLECKSRSCLKQVDSKIEKVIQVDWKSISIFPEEAQRFR
tara:strand:+ start:732 stop:920 length:189 start_codon:yes stop_codon:yes gene_type:complete